MSLSVVTVSDLQEKNNERLFNDPNFKDKR